MPHFIIECNKELSNKINLKLITQTVFDAALNSELFAKSNIKSRLRIFDESIVAGKELDFIHVWGYIREGRSDEQKRMLSEEIVNQIKKVSKDVFVVSSNIQELDKASYFKIQLA